MRITFHGLLVILHLLIAVASFVLTVSFLGGPWHWPAAAIASLAVTANAVLVVSGLAMKRRWVRWCLLSMVLLVALPTVALLAGSILWPESFALVVIGIFGAFALCEVAGFATACGFPASCR